MAADLEDGVLPVSVKPENRDRPMAGWRNGSSLQQDSFDLYPHTSSVFHTAAHQSDGNEGEQDLSGSVVLSSARRTGAVLGAHEVTEQRLDVKHSLNMTRRQIPSYLVHPLLTALLVWSADYSVITMGSTWRKQEHTDFINGYLTSYSDHSKAGTLKTVFWPDFFDKWFEQWPVPTPSAEDIEKEKSPGAALKAERTKRVNVSVPRPPRLPAMSA